MMGRRLKKQEVGEEHHLTGFAEDGGLRTALSDLSNSAP